MCDLICYNKIPNKTIIMEYNKTYIYKKVKYKIKNTRLYNIVCSCVSIYIHLMCMYIHIYVYIQIL